MWHRHRSDSPLASGQARSAWCRCGHCSGWLHLPGQGFQRMTYVLGHLVTTGLGPVYDGIGHLLLSPTDYVPVIAISLLAGLRGPAAGRWTLFALPAAWLVGGIVGINSTGVPKF